MTGRFSRAGALATFAAVVFAGGCHRADAQKDAAVESCVSAVHAADSEADAGAAGKAMAAACAPLFSEAGCRDGYIRAFSDQTAPSDRARLLTNACESAYCPKLEPKPSLCVGESTDLATLSQQWKDFQKAVLTRDLGAARAERVFDAMEESAKKRKERLAPSADGGGADGGPVTPAR